MSIESLRIQGFRSLRHVTWKPGKLNVLIGPNGSGKSNLLKGLDLLYAAAKGDLSETMISQGGMGALLWESQESKLIWQLDTPVREIGQTLRLTLKLHKLTYNFFVEHEALSSLPSDHILFERKHRQVVVYDAEGKEPWPEGLPLGRKPNDQETILASDAWIYPEPMILADRLRNWSIYHDFRTDQDAAIRQAGVARFEQQLSLDDQNLNPVLHTLYTGNREFERDIDSAMRAAFWEDYEWTAKPV